MKVGSVVIVGNVLSASPVLLSCQGLKGVISRQTGRLSTRQLWLVLLLTGKTYAFYENELEEIGA